ncbi:hypothetical protein BACSP_03737 [Bacillus sp. T2.9-1]|nr:hypothetical protein [Bacillus sp. T2.9-1]CAI9394416.1 hypothetical protein BACSP_03737 [Bacillus sp. T2.9-1]
MNLIDIQLKDDLVKLYKYRNTVHIESELIFGVFFLHLDSQKPTELIP